jgi:uncharacterized protein YbjQ (UPF0145 family)
MSPLFGRGRGGGPPRDPAHEQAQAQRDQESLERLAAGHIPLNAAERLATLASAGADASSPFASDLSVQEYALLHSLEIVPITLVMGSSIYQVGWQGTFYMVPTEIQSLSHAYNESRRLALNRLLEETTLVGADAVVGVRIEQGRHDFAAGTVEFVAIGTAVRLPPKLRGSHGPVLTDLEGQEFWQLCAAGVRPVGIAAHTSVHYVPATWQTARTMGGGMFGGSWYNQELGDFTQGVYDAREKAMTYVTQQAAALGADGIIGVKLEEHASGRRVSRGGIECDDMIVTFHVIGTAVREDPSLADGVSAVPTTILSLA